MDKDLVLAMADMNIFTSNSLPNEWASTVTTASPSWLVVDGNWSATDIREWIRAGRAAGARIAFEPVSVSKSERLFLPRTVAEPGVFPNHDIDLTTPNELELAAMHAAARKGEHLDGLAWFGVIDALNLGASGARDRFDRLAGRHATDAGIPAQSVQLLPFVPTVVAKMGSRGALLTALLGPDDPRLRDPAEDRFVLSRARPGAHPGLAEAAPRPSQ